MIWGLNLNAWIIQDGNYGDFAKGQRAEFAVEFWPGELVPCAPQPPSAAKLGDDVYRVTATVASRAEETVVLDCGILVYSTHVEEPLRSAREGDCLAGELSLGVDPFDYFEQLYRVPGMPPLIYGWEVVRIRRQTAPLADLGRGVVERDPEQLGWTDVEATDAWADDDGNADYLLDCRLLPDPPKRSSVTAA